MTGMIILGLIIALATGIAIGTQSTITSRIGALIGSFRTGVLVNLAGGLLAAMIYVVLLIVKGKGFWQIPQSTLILLPIAGAIGIMVITGVAFSLQRTGVAVGLATLILGQMVVSVIADSKGWGGSAPIPLNWPRILGLIVIALGIFLLVPKK